MTASFREGASLESWSRTRRITRKAYSKRTLVELAEFSGRVGICDWHPRLGTRILEILHSSTANYPPLSPAPKLAIILRHTQISDPPASRQGRSGVVFALPRSQCELPTYHNHVAPTWS